MAIASPGLAVAMEIDVSGLPFEERDGRFRSELEIGFFLLDGAGSIAEGDGRKVRLDLDSAEFADLRRRGLRALSILPARAGRSQIAVAARETREGRSGLLYWHADVPPKPASSLAEIVVTSAVESSVPVLSSERDRERLSLFPTTRREFARRDELWLQAPPGLGGATARVLRQDGPVAIEARFREEEKPLRLPLADLGPGAYVLEITSGNPDEDPRTVAFRVQ
jgi:hypothetical protein